MKGYIPLLLFVVLSGYGTYTAMALSVPPWGAIILAAIAEALMLWRGIVKARRERNEAAEALRQAKIRQSAVKYWRRDESRPGIVMVSWEPPTYEDDESEGA